jgi:Domain of unknown function (DUF4333)
MGSTVGLATVLAMLRQARSPGLGVAVLAVCSLTGCGSSKPKLDTAVVERAVAASILTQHHLHANVGCPSKVPRRAGFAFTCTARLNVGEYPVLVTQTNGSGHVSYQNKTPLVTLNIARVEQAISRSILSQRHLRSTVTCPLEVIQKAGIAFTCTATVNGQRYPFSVTEIDGSGHVRYLGLR